MPVAGSDRACDGREEKKGLETVEALGDGGGWLPINKPASRAVEHWCGLLRVKRPAGGEQARSAAEKCCLTGGVGDKHRLDMPVTAQRDGDLI